MNVKQAASIAMEHIKDVFDSEKTDNIGFEEAIFQENYKDFGQGVWDITIGFSRPWDYPKAGLMIGLRSQNPAREYKIVRIDDKTGEIIAIEIREMQQ